MTLSLILLIFLGPLLAVAPATLAAAAQTIDVTRKVFGR